ncbi:MAG: alpha/beta hydrolase [Elusimicrobia bacterium]|nr:alpha/beta hydrolase [Elusimicrobiota bacterium]
MTAWPALLGAVLVLGVVAACWWGSNVVFFPPRMLPMTVFPEQYSLRYEKVSFASSDGLTLRGWLIPAAAATDKTIFMCHGWGDNKGDLLSRFHFLAKRWNLFLFDSRHHGESEGALSTIGSLEARDFDAALAWLKAHRPAWTERLGLLGLSMGAGMAIRGQAVHGGFRCALLESPFRSFNEVIRQFCSNAYHLPYYPFVWLTLVIIRLRIGFESEPYSPVYHAPRMPPIPLLYVSGEHDRLMPLSEVRAVFDASPEPKELWVVPGGTHGKCHEAVGPEYERRVVEFFALHL